MNNVIDIKPNVIIGDNYAGELVLSSWNGFQSRQGFYGSKDSNEISTGFFKVSIQGKEVDYIKSTTIEQVNSIKFLVDNSDQVRDEVLKGLLNKISELKEIYGDLIPEINKIDDFKSFVGLSKIHIMSSDKDDFAYIGFELGCEWDDEHGVGVMMHKDRVVAIGLADTSFDCWVTFKDNGTTEIERRKWDVANAKLQLESLTKVNIKPWWRFW